MTFLSETQDRCQVPAQFDLQLFLFGYKAHFFNKLAQNVGSFGSRVVARESGV
jgi:hypothetical protein